MKQIISKYFLPPIKKGTLRCSFLPSLVLGESQAHVAGLPHHTPGIHPQFLARHSTDQSLLNNNQTRTRNPQISGTRSQMRPDVDSQNQFIVGHKYPNHRNMPTEQDDTAGWPSTMERRRITERWCSCFRLVVSKPY